MDFIENAVMVAGGEARRGVRGEGSVFKRRSVTRRKKKALPFPSFRKFELLVCGIHKKRKKRGKMTSPLE